MSERNEPEQRSHIQVRAWHIILLILAVITCILLAYWQWTRYKSGTGTFQNLGYALQWPFFGAFFVYAYRVGLRMENDKIDTLNADDSLDDLYEADLARYGETSGETDEEITALDDALLPPRPELSIEEFNALNQPRRGVTTTDES